MKRVHFICRGNSFRSRLAEAYLKSLNLKGITVLSSGTVAADHAAINGPLLNCTRHVLGLHHILKYDKGHWEQLTASRLSGNDITIFMGQLSYEEAKKIGEIPPHIFIWDVPDSGELFEGVRTPLASDPNINEFADQTYYRIKKLIDDDLLKELK